MEKVLFAFLVLCVIARASDEPYDHEYWHDQASQIAYKEIEFARNSTRPDAVARSLIRPVTCKVEDNEIRNHFIEQSRCGEPKDILVKIKPPSAQERITPSAVWVKRCTGRCKYYVTYALCHPRETVFRDIPILITNVETGQESCSSYRLEEHVACDCCCLLGNTCRPAHSEPSSCTCQCPPSSIPESINNSTSTLKEQAK